MDAPPRLPQQDRADFERLLDEALADPGIRAALARGAVTADRLRVLARESLPEILAAAADEYGDYARLRAAAELAGALGGPRTEGCRGLLRGGGGLVGALAVLTPVLAGIASVFFFVIAAALRLADAQRHLAGAVVEAGWTAAIIAAASAVAGVLGLLATAARHRTGDPASPAGPHPAAEELHRAREAWRAALLSRGVRPFLLRHPAGGLPADR